MVFCRNYLSLLTLVKATIALRSYLLAYIYGPSHSWASRHAKLCLFLITYAGIVFRSEIAIMLVTHTIYLLFQQRASLADVSRAGIAGVALGLATTVSIDSFFWQQFPLWPEWTGFYYNTILGKSTEWGVSPWHHYFLSAIPKLVMNPLVTIICLPTAISTPAIQSRSNAILFPSLSFVAIYSLLPHKEWRFIVYVVPPLTAAAAAGAGWIWTRRDKRIWYRFWSIALVLSVVGSFLGSSLLLGVSSLNYPGGQALTRLHRMSSWGKHGTVKVHLDNLSCQTGITRFLQLSPPEISPALHKTKRSSATWIYDKTENERDLLDPAFMTQFHYVLTENPARVPGRWDVLDIIYGFSGIRVLKPADAGKQDEDIGIEMGDGRKVRAVVAPEFRAWWYQRLLQLEESALKITKGWWVRLKMEPKIWILIQIKPDPGPDYL